MFILMKRLWCHNSTTSLLWYWNMCERWLWSFCCSENRLVSHDSSFAKCKALGACIICFDGSWQQVSQRSLLYIGFKLWLQKNLKSCHGFGHRDTIGLAERLVLWDGKPWHDLGNRDAIQQLTHQVYLKGTGHNGWVRSDRGAIGQNRDAILDLCD